MDIDELGIPNIGVKQYGTRRDPLEMVEAPTRLEAWDGYITERRENAKLIADGTVLVQFACKATSPPEQWGADLLAYKHLLEDQYEIRDNIVRTLIEKFEWFKETYDLDPTDDPDVADITPENKNDFDLRTFIGPKSLSIHEITKDGVPYLEWYLNCAWDPEHGLAAVTHRTRVIDLDRGETDIYKIFEDNGTLEEELKTAEQFSKRPKRIAPKPWWKFW